MLGADSSGPWCVEQQHGACASIACKPAHCAGLLQQQTVPVRLRAVPVAASLFSFVWSSKPRLKPGFHYFRGGHCDVNVCVG